MSNNLMDNKPTKIVNNDDKDDKDDDNDDGDEDDDERIKNEAKNVNDDNSDGATIQRQRIRKRGGPRGPASNVQQRSTPWGAGSLLAGMQLETRRIKKM
jgi:hypothetical protein